jgi:hypothetical protein
MRRSNVGISPRGNVGKLCEIRPYEGMIIDGVANLTEAQFSTLKALGANA